MMLYRIGEILSYNLYFYFILGLLCLIVFKCLSGVFVDYRIPTTAINVSDIKMFKAEWLSF